jgi:hypothetical protein
MTNHPSRNWRARMRASSPEAARAIYARRVEGALDPVLVRLMLCEAYEQGYTDAREAMRRRDS